MLIRGEDYLLVLVRVYGNTAEGGKPITIFFPNKTIEGRCSPFERV